MDQTCRERMDKKLKGDNYSKRIDSIRRFERQLTDNGYVLLKFFMQIDRKEQEKRMGILLESKDTRWRVNEYDLWQNDYWDSFNEQMAELGNNLRDSGIEVRQMSREEMEKMQETIRQSLKGLDAYAIAE